MNVTTRTQVIGSIITGDVSDDTLAAAKAGDRDAAASILVHMESRLSSQARRAARVAGSDDGIDRSEDLLQEASLISLECLARYEGAALDAFRAYVYAYVEKELPARARDMANGTDDDSDGKKLFAQMVKHFRNADPNRRLSYSDYLNLAEKAVQDSAMVSILNGGAYKSRFRMSPDAAYAARLAYQGAISIYQGVGSEDDSITLADTLADRTDGSTVEALADVTTYGVRPIMWTMAARALEDTLTLPRDAGQRAAILTALDRFRAGTVLESDLDLMESLPCRSKAQGDAVAMLRALFIQRESEPEASQAQKTADAALGRGSVALTTQRAQMEAGIDRVVKRTLLRRVLGSMAPRQAYILAATYGFMGTFKDDAQIARAMAKSGVADIDAARVRKDREKARASFAKKWADLVAKSGSEAAALELAAQKVAANIAKAEAQGITFLTDIQEGTSSPDPK